MDKKISQLKNIIVKNTNNINQIICKISGQRVASGDAVRVESHKNNTESISKEYYKHQIFESINLTELQRNSILSIIVLDGIVKNKNNKATLKNYKNKHTLFEMPTYIIEIKNQLEIYLFSNDASIKKYFNILKKYKNIITSIKINISNQLLDIHFLYNNFESYLKDISKEYKKIYPPFYKKLVEYIKGINKAYNPISKKSVIKIW